MILIDLAGQPPHCREPDRRQGRRRRRSRRHLCCRPSARAASSTPDIRDRSRGSTRDFVRRSVCCHRASLVGKPPREPAWRSEGWNPLLSLRVSHGVECSGIRGDRDGRFVDLALPAGTKIDREGPVLIRTAFIDLHELTFSELGSHFHSSGGCGPFDRRLLPVGDEALARVVKKDPSALCSVGHFLLWDVDDPESAMPYLEAATIHGKVKAAFDLITLALFRRP